MTQADGLDWSTHVAMWLIFIIFNASIIVLTRSTTRNINIKKVLREKSSSPAPSATDPLPQDPNDNTSYSRVSGMIGSIIVACFVWGLGNVLLIQAFANPADIASILHGVGPFILSSSALFAPYAFNQLAQVFKS